MAKATIGATLRKFARFGLYFAVNLYYRLLLFTPYGQIKQHVTTSYGPEAPYTTARWIGYHVFHSARYVPGATCLSRAFTAQYFLKRKGYESYMAIGVADAANGLTAHAWVMSGQKIVVGNEEGQLKNYTLLTQLGRPKT